MTSIYLHAVGSFVSHSGVQPALNMLQNGAPLEDGNYLGFGGNNTVLVMGVGV
jgi:hypothetical protein